MLDMKNLSMKLPIPLNKHGENLLKNSPKFWIVFLKLIGDNLTEEDKKIYRGHLQEAFRDKPQEFQMLVNELCGLLYLDLEPV